MISIQSYESFSSAINMNRTISSAPGFNIFFRIEFPAASLEIHIPYHAEHRPFAPGPVMHGDHRMWMSLCPDPCDIQGCKACRHFSQGREHEAVLNLCCIEKSGNQAEHHVQRLACGDGPFLRINQGPVVADPLVTLHPIDNRTFSYREIVVMMYTGLVNHVPKVVKEIIFFS